MSVAELKKQLNDAMEEERKNSCNNALKVTQQMFVSNKQFYDALETLFTKNLVSINVMTDSHYQHISSSMLQHGNVRQILFILDFGTHKITCSFSPRSRQCMTMLTINGKQICTATDANDMFRKKDADDGWLMVVAELLQTSVNDNTLHRALFFGAIEAVVSRYIVECSKMDNPFIIPQQFEVIWKEVFSGE